MTAQQVKVIFRKWRFGVIAVFPEVAATMGAAYCQSFDNCDGWGAIHAALMMQQSRPATPEEYAALKRRLEADYEYDLVLVERLTQAHYETRRRDILGGQGILED